MHCKVSPMHALPLQLATYIHTPYLLWCGYMEYLFENQLSVELTKHSRPGNVYDEEGESPTLRACGTNAIFNVLCFSAIL